MGIHSLADPAPSISDGSRSIVVMPAFNEASRSVEGKPLGAPFEEAIEDYKKSGLEIVIANDGSTDNTAEVARSHGLTVISHRDDQNHRKWGTLKFVIDEVLKDRSVNEVAIVDSDNSYPLKGVLQLLSIVECGDADIAIAQRPETSESHANLMRRVGHWGIARLATTKSAKHRDNQAGAKALNRISAERALADIPAATGLLGDTALLLIAEQRYGLQIAEVPIPMQVTEGSRINPMRQLPTLAKESWAIQRLAKELEEQSIDNVLSTSNSGQSSSSRHSDYAFLPGDLGL